MNDLHNDLNMLNAGKLLSVKRARTTDDNIKCKIDIASNYRGVSISRGESYIPDPIKLSRTLESLDLSVKDTSNIEKLLNTITKEFKDLSSDIKDKLVKIIYKRVESNITTELAKINGSSHNNIPEAFKLYTDFGLQPCQICYSDPNIYAVFDCGHVFCSDCSIKLNTCATCRKLISKTIYYIVSRPELPIELTSQLDLLVRPGEVSILTDKSEIPSIRLGESLITVTYGLQQITDNCNPCVISVTATKAVEAIAESSINIAFLLDVSGSMQIAAPEVVRQLETYITNLPINSIISMHVFSTYYSRVFPATTLGPETLPYMIRQLKTIYTGGGTCLDKGIIGLKENLDPNTQVVIITDGATSNKDLSTSEFTSLRTTNPVTLIGFGESYSYTNCIDIVSGDATVFSEALTAENLINSVNDRVNAGIRIVIDFDKENNVLYTSTKIRSGNRIEFINHDIPFRCVLFNGLPNSININGTKIMPTHDSALDGLGNVILYEFIFNEYIKELANGMIWFPGHALKTKMLLKAIKNRIDTDKKIIGGQIYTRLFKFIETLHKSCCDVLKRPNYGYSYGGLGRESSNGIARGVSDSLRACSSSGTDDPY